MIGVIYRSLEWLSLNTLLVCNGTVVTRFTQPFDVFYRICVMSAAMGYADSRWRILRFTSPNQASGKY